MRKILSICCAGLAFAGQGDWQKRMLLLGLFQLRKGAELQVNKKGDE